MDPRKELINLIQNRSLNIIRDARRSYQVELEERRELDHRRLASKAKASHINWVTAWGGVSSLPALLPPGANLPATAALILVEIQQSVESGLRCGARLAVLAGCMDDEQILRTVLPALLGSTKRRAAAIGATALVKEPLEIFLERMAMHLVSKLGENYVKRFPGRALPVIGIGVGTALSHVDGRWTASRIARAVDDEWGTAA